MKILISALLVAATIMPLEAEAQKPAPHHYVKKEQGSFGYKTLHGSEDYRGGGSSNPLVMVQYEGRGLDGSYLARWSDAGITYHAYCQAPCEIVKVSTLGTGVMTSEEPIRAEKGSMIWAIFQDAMAEQLK